MSNDTDQNHEPEGLPEGLPPKSPGGMMEHQDPKHEDDLGAQGGGETENIDLGGEKDDTYNPSTVEANRMRQQGNGVGQRDLDHQRDPGGEGSDEFGQLSDSSSRQAGVEQAPGGSGVEQI